MREIEREIERDRERERKGRGGGGGNDGTASFKARHNTPDQKVKDISETIRRKWCPEWTGM